MDTTGLKLIIMLMVRIRLFSRISVGTLDKFPRTAHIERSLRAGSIQGISQTDPLVFTVQELHTILYGGVGIGNPHTDFSLSD